MDKDIENKIDIDMDDEILCMDCGQIWISYTDYYCEKCELKHNREIKNV
jgi:hypothetical protein